MGRYKSASNVAFLVAFLGAYTGWFVHVDPGAIDVQTGLRVIEELELVCPIILCVGVEPI